MPTEHRTAHTQPVLGDVCPSAKVRTAVTSKENPKDRDSLGLGKEAFYKIYGVPKWGVLGFVLISESVRKSGIVCFVCVFMLVCASFVEQ